MHTGQDKDILRKHSQFGKLRWQYKRSQRSPTLPDKPSKYLKTTPKKEKR